MQHVPKGDVEGGRGQGLCKARWPGSTVMGPVEVGLLLSPVNGDRTAISQDSAGGDRKIIIRQGPGKAVPHLESRAPGYLHDLRLLRFGSDGRVPADIGHAHRWEV